MDSIRFMDEKTCSKCGEAKPITEFYNRKTPLGRTFYPAECRACHRAAVALATDKVAANEYRKAWEKRPEVVARRKVYYAANRERLLAVQRSESGALRQTLRQANMTSDQYQALWDAQGGLCAICRLPETTLSTAGKPRQLAVDHDHACCPDKKSCGNCVRGLLCYRCNLLLGKVENNDWMSRAAAYLIGGET